MKKLKSLPIGIQLSMLVAVIVIVVFLNLIMNYTKAAEVIEEKNSNYLSQMISQINQTISSNSNQLKRILEKTAYNRTIVQAYLNEPDPLVKYGRYSELTDYMSDMMNMKEGILDIALFGTDGTKINLNGDINNLVPFIGEVPDKRLYYYSGFQNIVIGSLSRNTFIIGCPIYSITDFEINDRIGTLMIVVEASVLLGSPHNLAEIDGARLYALDRKDQLFSSNDKEVKLGSPYSQLVMKGERNNSFIQEGSIPDLDGKLIFILPKKELFSGIEAILERSFLILILSLVLLVIPFYLVVNNILRPLKKLMGFMSHFKLGLIGNLSKRIHLRGYAEISIMANQFNRMLDEIDGLTTSLLESNTKLYKAELVKKQAELAFLQSQINPHFLYNTLESIKGMAVEQGSEEIFHMVKSLAYVFRYSIKAADIIPLQEEITLVKSHIYIQQIRFVNRFTVAYQFQESILTSRVPKMILQPLVENAIFHGIEPKTGSGHLMITGEVLEGELVLTIRDNGVGIERDKLKELQATIISFQETEEDRPGGIGLVNVNNRIKMQYGENYGIVITSELGIGTEIQIRLPYKEELSV
ncbi:sensor histidine kinase [Paenibacillus albidus]|uniref:sensor histidine kinase n=1 Tax=Paenibacillus albidus TaxID=2041023 RepID=UPI001BEB8AA0|nr:sensor histidine kinase [Paenibacillus albidus]MBT2288408.1 sensor histidine kinase [Paenibacillus albidus]